MKNINTKIVLFVVFTLIAAGCSTTKKVPEGEYLLTKNKFEFEGKDKPFSSEVPEYVRQRPNSAALGLIPLKLLMYNAVPSKFDTTFSQYNDLSRLRKTQESLDSLLVKNGLEEYEGRSLWLKRLMFNQGEPPVIIDSTMSDFSEKNLENFYFDRGYFDAEVESIVKKDSASKKGSITYKINPGEASMIESYNYEISDSTIQRHFETLTRRGTNIKVGERYDLDNFMKERDQIVDFLKNRGYWRFNDDGQAIEFTADTTFSTKALDIKLLIPVESSDSAIAKKIFPRYRYRNIYIYPDSDPVADGEFPPTYYDTIYDGYHLRYTDPKMKYRPKFFTDAIVMRDSSLYRLNAEVQTRRNFSKREGVTMTGFEEVAISDEKIGDDNLLDVSFYFRPKKKYDLFYGAELSWSEFMNFGVSPRVSLLARNLFGGGENLETTLRGTLGNVNKKFSNESSFFNAFELAFQSKINFPYLLTPFNMDNILGKRYFKQTDLRIGASVQKNIGLDRITYSTGLDYNVSFRDTHSHMLSFLNIEFVNNLQKGNYFNVFEGDNSIKNNFFNRHYFMYNPSAAIGYDQGEYTNDEIIDMIYNDQGFLNSLDNEGLEDLAIFENMNFRKNTITQDVLILSLIYQYSLNQNERRNIKHPWYFRGRVELAGNVLNLLDRTIDFPKTTTSQGEQSGTIFNVPYSQFVRIDLDLRKYFNLGHQSTLATRAFVGLIQPYGNTDFIPFSRSFTAGGANDNRAWAAATLGPAGLPRYAGGDDVFAIERLKLLFSAEYRFNIYERFNSAFFVDAGNIWGTDKNDDLTVFKFDRFYKELGIGAGFGIRLDLTYFLLRFDFAYKIHDPSYPEGSRWRFDDINLLKPRLAFGINYPF